MLREPLVNELYTTIIKDRDLSQMLSYRNANDEGIVVRLPK